MPLKTASKSASVSAAALADTFGGVEEYLLGEPVPEDTYSLRIVGPKVDHTQAGVPYVRARAVITEGDYTNQSIFEKMWLNTVNNKGEPSKALGMTKALVRTICGDVPADLNRISPTDKEALAVAIVQAINGKDFHGKVVQEAEYEKDINNKFILGPDGKKKVVRYVNRLRAMSAVR